MPDRKPGLEDRARQLFQDATQAQVQGNSQEAKSLFDQAGSLGEFLFDLLPNNDRRRNRFARIAMEGYYHAGDISKAVFVAQRVQPVNGRRDQDYIAVQNILKEIQRPHSLTSRP